MSDSPLLLAIDNGTQTVRALLFDENGTLLASAHKPIEPYFSRYHGWAEQDTEVFWRAVCTVCREIVDREDVNAAAIAGVAVTAQRATVVSLDEAGNPLRPAIVWLDQRRCESPPKMPWPIELGAWLTGRRQVLRNLQAEAECNWIAERQPEVAAATDRFLFLGGYLNWRLTGERVDSQAAQVGYAPFDYKQQRWAGRRDPLWKALAVRREQLPELLPAGQQLGAVTATAADETGLARDLPVFAAGTDKGCELLGSGCLEPSLAGISYGTTATINTVNSKYVEATPPMPAYPAAVPNRWNSEVMIRRGFWMVEWFRREFGADLLGGDDHGDDRAYRRLEAMLAETPPGADGLLLQPYWSAGTPFPGPEARGAVIGFGDMHGRAHLYRAIVEGIAHGLRDAGNRLERRNRTPIERLRVAGGGARSDAVMQITADVFGLVAERPRVTEASGLGAAINLAVGLGLYSDYAAAVAAMTEVGDRFEPNDENERLYSQIHNDVYRGMYGRLAPLYRSLRRITGFPP